MISITVINTNKLFACMHEVFPWINKGLWDAADAFWVLTHHKQDL